MSYGFGSEEIKQESSWRYPLAIFIATLILCAVFLYYYVGPSVDEFSGNTPSPAISEEPVRLVIGGTTFVVPTNYTVFPRDRRGGVREEVALYALWPTLSGYTPARRSDFIENAEDTRRVDILISERISPFNEAERIEILYMPQTIDRRGVRTPYRLVKYAFRDQRANVPTSGYAHSELYIGDTEDGDTAAIFCLEEKTDIQSPECWREYEYGSGVTISYRFKRPYLAEWRAIDARVRALVQGFINDD